MNGIWKKTLKRSNHDFKGPAKGEEVAEQQGCVWDGSGLTPVRMRMRMRMTPRSSTRWFPRTVHLLELEQEHVTGEERRGNDRRKRATMRISGKGVAEAFANLKKLLEKLKNMNPNGERFSLIEMIVHGAVFAYKQMCNAKRKQTKRALCVYFRKE